MGVASIVNKAEIQIYSTLISVMSGINHLKTGDSQAVNLPIQAMPLIDPAPSKSYEEVPVKPVSMKWVYIQHALISLLLWTILGFAAGFLIGMISGG